MFEFKALSDPTRRRIVEMLAMHEFSMGEIAGKFQMSGPAVSQHLQVLKKAGLVRVRTDAQRRIYGLDPDGLREVGRWLEGIQGASTGTALPERPHRPTHDFLQA